MKRRWGLPEIEGRGWGPPAREGGGRRGWGLGPEGPSSHAGLWAGGPAALLSGQRYRSDGVC